MLHDGEDDIALLAARQCIWPRWDVEWPKSVAAEVECRLSRLAAPRHIPRCRADVATIEVCITNHDGFSLHLYAVSAGVPSSNFTVPIEQLVSLAHTHHSQDQKSNFTLTRH